jgi:hypothetical protein
MVEAGESVRHRGHHPVYVAEHQMHLPVEHVKNGARKKKKEDINGVYMLT